MASAAHAQHHFPVDRPKPTPRARRNLRSVRHKRLALVSAGVLCALGVLALLYAHFALAQQPTTSTLEDHLLPADLFIQSVVQDDGALGWRELCPGLQAQVTKSELVQAAQASRAALEKQDVTLTAGLVSVRAQASGGQVREYLLTAHWPDGTMQLRTYTIVTQASGCVADVQTQ